MSTKRRVLEEGSLQESEKTDPGKATREALTGADESNLLIVMVRDVLQHMKEQNEQHQEVLLSQKESNNRLQKASQQMILLLVMVVVGTIMVGFMVVSLDKNAKDLRGIADEQAKLQMGYRDLERKLSDKLNATSKSISVQVEKIEKKVEETPKVTADQKGKLRIEVPVANSAKPGEKKPTKAVIPLQAPPPVELK